MDPELLERITARHKELDELEEQLANQLAEVRAKRDEVAVTEKVLERMSSCSLPVPPSIRPLTVRKRGACLRQRGLHVP
ncbi:hypothetical protein [Streptomyces sp. WG7]|uniref:hypothetical protein n=1 Tax=Streptomyces sp. WG7 TaxID=3417650 RepID=UPI003CEFEAAD